MLILKELEGNIIPAENWRLAGLLHPAGAETRGNATAAWAGGVRQEEFLKTKKRQPGCRTPNRVSYESKYNTGYWKVKENFWIAEWFLLILTGREGSTRR